MFKINFALFYLLLMLMKSDFLQLVLVELVVVLDLDLSRTLVTEMVGASEAKLELWFELVVELVV